MLDVTKPVEMCFNQQIYPARIICTDCIGNQENNIIALAMIDGTEMTWHFRQNGTTSAKSIYLRNKKDCRWINVYSDIDGDFYCGRFYKSEHKARESGEVNGAYVTTIPVEW